MKNGLRFLAAVLTVNIFMFSWLYLTLSMRGAVAETAPAASDRAAIQEQPAGGKPDLDVVPATRRIYQETGSQNGEPRHLSMPLDTGVKTGPELNAFNRNRCDVQLTLTQPQTRLADAASAALGELRCRLQ